MCGIGNDRDTDILLNGHLIVGFKHASRIDWRDAEALCNIVCGEIGLRAVVDEKADFVGKGELCIGLNGNRFGNPEEHPQQNLRQAFCVILLLQKGID